MKKFLCVFLVVFILAFLFAALDSGGDILTTTEDNAIIRVPGEFDEKDIEFLYNSKYIKYKIENSEISLNFLKPGYYYLEIMDEEYVFNYVTPTTTIYEIDLLESEYSAIKAIELGRSLKTAFLISVYFGIIILVGWYFAPWLAAKITTRKPKVKKQRPEAKKEFENDL